MSEKNGKNRILVSTIIVAVLLIAFFLPRIIVAHFGTSDPWACYLYQYSFGFLTFGIGILLILKTKACQFGRGSDSLWFKWLLAGFCLFAVVHAIWIYFAETMPVKGGF